MDRTAKTNSQLSHNVQLSRALLPSAEKLFLTTEIKQLEALNHSLRRVRSGLQLAKPSVETGASDIDLSSDSFSRGIKAAGQCRGRSLRPAVERVSKDARTGDMKSRTFLSVNRVELLTGLNRSISNLDRLLKINTEISPSFSFSDLFQRAISDERSFQVKKQIDECANSLGRLKQILFR